MSLGGEWPRPMCRGEETKLNLVDVLVAAHLLPGQIGTALLRTVHNKNCQQGSDVQGKEDFHAYRIS